MARVGHGHGGRQEPTTSAFVKYTLFFLNVLFWIVGSVILMFGGYVLMESKVYFQNLADISFQPAILFFLVGIVIFIITFIGCIGALRENTCLLATYSVILTTILLLMVGCGVVGFVFQDKINEVKIILSLKKAIVFYRDPKRADLHNLIDTTQTEFQCCGIESYNDWDANVYFNCSSPGSESCGVPYSCCLIELQLNRQCGYRIRKPGVSYAQKRKAIYTIGCFEQGKLWISTNLYFIGIACIVVLALQLISIILAMKLREEVKAIKIL